MSRNMFLLKNTFTTQNETINYFDNILDKLNTFNYDRSSNRLILRIKINNSKEKIGTDDIILTKQVLDFFNNLIGNLCSIDVKLNENMNRSYYNSEIAPQMYWLTLNNTETNTEERLATLGLIELVVFQGNKIKYLDKVLQVDDNIKSELNSTSNMLDVQTFKKLASDYVRNLFNVEYLTNRYVYLKNIKPDMVAGINKLTTTTMNMIKKDSEMFCKKIELYVDVNKNKMFTLKNNFKNIAVDLSKFKSNIKNRLFTIIDFGNEKNIYLNDILSKFYNISPSMKSISGIKLPMNVTDFNTIKIIPLFILNSNLSEEQKKSYIGLYSMLHYTIKSRDFINLNNYLENKQITIQDELKEVINSPTNILTPKEVQDVFYNHYKKRFEELLMNKNK